MLQGVEENHKKSVFKETIATVTTLVVEGVNTNKITESGGNFGTWLLTRFNAVKICDWANNCVPPSMINDTEINYEHSQGTAILHSGAYVMGLDDNRGTNNRIAIDYNGLTGPNMVGQDQMLINVCNASKCDWTQYGWADGPGAVVADDSISDTLYKSLFGR